MQEVLYFGVAHWDHIALLIMVADKVVAETHWTKGDLIMKVVKAVAYTLFGKSKKK